MLRLVRGVVVPVALVVLLGGCSSEGMGPREFFGSLAGAVGGAFIGNEIGQGSGRVLATAAGTLIGLGVGADIGRSLDRANLLYENRIRVRRGHSQQTPVPGFPSAGAVDSWWFDDRGGGARQHGGTIRDAHDCRPLEGGLKPAFACRNGIGQWFVLQ